VRCEVVAVGTELLLGQVVDTNSSWIGEQLALSGIDSYFQTKVGDNLGRIVGSIRLALERSDAVIICGGLGPTQDDITREALAEVMGAPLVRDPEMIEHIARMFASRNRAMPENNYRQAERPETAAFIPNPNGTAPGLVCPIGEKVAYAVPGVPYEMRAMCEASVLPDLRARSGEQAVILSRTLRTWGLSESGVAEVVSPRLEALDETPGGPTIAFLASGIEGIKVRLTVKAPTRDEAVAMLEKEDAELRALLGSVVFGVDDENMEAAVGALLEERGLTLGVAESMTGGLVASRLVNVAGSSAWFKGGVVAYDSQVKFDVLGVPVGPVVSEAAAQAMAEGVARVVKADVGLSVTGVAGPAEQEGKPAGTVYLGVLLDGETTVSHLQMPGDRERIRQFATISLLDMLRRRLLDSV
jgi:nicotinamide-nucleotide amidase